MKRDANIGVNGFFVGLGIVLAVLWSPWFVLMTASGALFLGYWWAQDAV